MPRTPLRPRDPAQTDSVGTAIFRERIRRHLSMQAAGAQLGCSHAAISLWERGERTPNAEMTARIESTWDIDLPRCCPNCLRPYADPGPSRHRGRKKGKDLRYPGMHDPKPALVARGRPMPTPTRARPAPLPPRRASAWGEREDFDALEEPDSAGQLAT